MRKLAICHSGPIDLARKIYYSLRRQNERFLIPFYKRIICNQVSLIAESVLVEPAAAPLSGNSEVYIIVNHGRLNHWIGVTISLFALALRQGWKPRLLELSKSAFPDDIVCHFRSKAKSAYESFPPTKKSAYIQTRLHTSACQSSVIYLKVYLRGKNQWPDLFCREN